MYRSLCLLALAGFIASAATASADDAPNEATMSRHQMMKECMAKQKASDGGMPIEDMKKNCRDVTATEEENAKSEQAEEKAEADADKKAPNP